MTQGGKRIGAGRKSKWNCETRTMRVPVHLVGEIEQFIEKRMGEALEVVPETPPAPALLELWQGDKRCQARTTKGGRCRLPSAIVHKLQHAGRSIEIGLCQRHCDQIRQGIEPRVHPSVFDSATKSNG
ncbi:hypothetical protein JOD69_004498 [Methylocaldum sp. RMAD-M]|jgi:hypothetical protein|nr:hypothetical protein [Methylocaldum sp. RMAD-M]